MKFAIIKILAISLLVVIPQICYADNDWLQAIAVKHEIIVPPTDVFVADHDGESFLVVVAQVDIRDDGKSSKIKTRLVARSLALKALNSFVNKIQVTSIESLETEKSYLVVERPGVPPQRVLMSNKSKYKESIIEKGEGFLNGMADVIDWISVDSKTFNYSLAIKL